MTRSWPAPGSPSLQYGAWRTLLEVGPSSAEDNEEVRALAENLGVVRLLNKAEFGQVLIPAILQREPSDLA
jgi:hypothetical protein